jgi:DoxX-like family
MNGLTWTQILTWTLAAFFLSGFVVNTFAVKVVGPEYRGWGYPDWFHFVSGGLDLAVSLLLLSPVTARWGVVLGCGIMVVAIATVIRFREYRRALPPFTVLVLLVIAGSSMLSH